MVRARIVSADVYHGWSMVVDVGRRDVAILLDG